jgi:outer membrane protein
MRAAPVDPHARRTAQKIVVYLGTIGAAGLVHGAALAQGPAEPGPNAASSATAPPSSSVPPVTAATSPAPSASATQGARAPDKAPELPVLTLAAAEHAALEAQPQLRVARAQTAVAQATADQLRSPLLPQVAGVASYSHQWGSFRTSAGTAGNATVTTSTNTGGGQSLANSFDLYSFGVSASQLIYDFGQTGERYSAAKSSVEATRYEEAVTRLNIVSTVRQAYFSARANKDLVDVASETLDNQQKHLVQVQAFVQVGTQPEIALAQQKAAVANALVQLIAARNNYDTAKAQLNQAAGLMGGTSYDVLDEEEPPIDDEDQPLETLVEKAFASRPELANLWKQEDAQHATIRSAKGGYGPSIAASGGASEAGTSLDTLSPNVNVGVSLTWELFQGGLTAATVRQAEANLTSIKAQQDLELLQVQLGVNSAQLAVRAAKSTIGAANDALASAAEQLRLAEQRYATGVGNIIELDDAQVTYTGAAAQVVTAKYNLASARAQLLAALGRT